MGHIAAPTTFTLKPVTDFGQLEEDDDEPQGYAAPPQQQQQQHKQPQGYGNYQQQPSQQVMGGPQGYAGQPSGYGGPHNTRQPVQQQQQHPGMRNAGPVDNSTMEDDDRWKGYPPPGQSSLKTNVKHVQPTTLVSDPTLDKNPSIVPYLPPQTTRPLPLLTT
ncbi:hypothetical protein BC829DRAFT_277707 [Chytridium lagenaria]|nr:hypothetical protein BC829DRAFT_277707 [Chytridium lagenaria]